MVLFGNLVGIHVTVSSYVAMDMANFIYVVGVLLLLSGDFGH